MLPKTRLGEKLFTNLEQCMPARSIPTPHTDPEDY